MSSYSRSLSITFVRYGAVIARSAAAPAVSGGLQSVQRATTTAPVLPRNYLSTTTSRAQTHASGDPITLCYAGKVPKLHPNYANVLGLRVSDKTLTYAVGLQVRPACVCLRPRASLCLCVLNFHATTCARVCARPCAAPAERRAAQRCPWSCRSGIRELVHAAHGVGEPSGACIGVACCTASLLSRVGYALLRPGAGWERDTRWNARWARCRR